jgi:hypothetical protein
MANYTCKRHNVLCELLIAKKQQLLCTTDDFSSFLGFLPIFNKTVSRG